MFISFAYLNFNTINAIANFNQPEEIAYFSTYVLPLAEKANIQTALNTYGTIRLEKGDYRGVSVVIGSNQTITGSTTNQVINAPSGYCKGSAGTYQLFITNGVINNCNCCTVNLINPVALL